MDDATFLVYLLVFEEDELAPVVEHQETGVDDALTFDGSGTDMIYRLIDRGISIEVGTKLHADGLAPRHDAEFLALAREMLGTIESHVFQEVSQATLARFFQDGAYTLGNIEVGESRLLVVKTDVISESVLQLTLSDRRILHHVLGRERYRDCNEKEQTKELFFHIKRPRY